MEMQIQELTRIPLAPGDVVVAATLFRDYVIVVTQQGNVFSLRRHQL